jgi:glycosyltransferase involved in cell wall biosynthesis
MKIGWIIPTVGCFGAVREVVEVSNELVNLGHAVRIYTPNSDPCVWLPCKTTYGNFEDALEDDLDVVIGVTDWDKDLDDIVFNSKSRLKCICLMGFDPSEEFAKFLKDEAESDNKGFLQIKENLNNSIVILTDSQWQIDWIKEVTGKDIGPAFGGVNTNMFYPRDRKLKNKPIKIIASGDTRSRKGWNVVDKAMEIVSAVRPEILFDTYWGKKYNQEELANFYRMADIFIDGHRRGGWCNPVAEAMASRLAVVCTDTPAVSSFAENEVTALVVPMEDYWEMAKAIVRLIDDRSLVENLALSAFTRIQEFSYPLIAKNLADKLEGKLNEL